MVTKLHLNVLSLTPNNYPASYLKADFTFHFGTLATAVRHYQSFLNSMDCHKIVHTMTNFGYVASCSDFLLVTTTEIDLFNVSATNNKIIVIRRKFLLR